MLWYDDKEGRVLPWKLKFLLRGIVLQKYLFFVIGCIIGTYYEKILNFVKYGTYTDRQGLLYGPFSPIYGVGIAIFILFLGKHNDARPLWKTL